MAGEVSRIGILGAGRVGTALARQALKTGYEVRIASSSPPADLAFMVDIMAPGAIAGTVETTVRDSDIVVLAVPLAKYRLLAPEFFDGKLVIDAMNYWGPTDGTLAEFEAGVLSSELVQRFLPGARLVRTLNQIGYHELEEQALPTGHPQRQALAIAGDDPQARATVASIIDRLGYDPVDAGPLAAAAAFNAGTPLFGGRFGRREVEDLLRSAEPVPEAATS
ncbi:MAG TPA: NAD(P)-binding domain-containing protein [Devosiaceae bacterium]|nr:NAD(P)-binding domain-containing protein [Devosiaceae bacterium]